VQGPADVLALIEQFASDYGSRFGEGSQAPEAGIRINTIRVAAFVHHETVQFGNIKPVPVEQRKQPPAPSSTRKCYFAGHKEAFDTPVWNRSDIDPGVQIRGPAIVASEVTTFLVNPGWNFVAALQNASWFLRDQLTH
jgi:N-methylhydantoinase A